VYGSCDGGVTVKNSDAVMRESLDCAAQQLHLSVHTVSNELMSTAGFVHQSLCLFNIHHANPFVADVEGHVGSDDQLYLLDFSRVFPPGNLLSVRILTISAQ